MNVYFYGAGQRGKEALLKYKGKMPSEYCFSGFIDTKKTGCYEGHPILKIEDVDKNSLVVISIGRSWEAVSVYKKLKGLGINNIYWFHASDDLAEQNREFLNSKNFLSTEHWGDTPFPQVEMHIMDSCNLNCIGCTHFSPIFEDKIPDFEETIRNVKLLKKKTKSIVRFYILGGEPLLNPNWDEYCCKIRELLPYTEIVLVTNGLLITKVPEDKWEIIKKLNIRISISEYEPTHKMIHEIRDVLELNEAVYDIRPFDNKTMFNKPLSLSSESKNKRLCISDGCINIWNGKIAKCPTLMYIDKFNDNYGTSLPNSGIMDLKTCLENDELIDKLTKPVELCKHCVENSIIWETCGKTPDISAFAIKD